MYTKSPSGISEMDTTSLNSIFHFLCMCMKQNHFNCTCVHNSVKTLKNYTNLFMLKKIFFLI